MTMHTRLCFWVLLLVPFVVYVPAIGQSYGVRDDYSHMREAHEEPGKIVRFIASHGRPLHGMLLEMSFSYLKSVNDLVWLRLASIALLAGLGIVLWRRVDSAGWPALDATALGLAVTLLPAAQICATWAYSWPWVLSLILAVAGFSAIEVEGEKGEKPRVMGILSGVCLYMLATLIYQSNALFAVVPMAAVALPGTTRRTRTELLHWFAVHLAVLFVSLGLSYLLLKLLFAGGVFHEAPRMQLEGNPLTKLGWFFWQPLPNALALYALRDDFHTGAVFFWAAVALVVSCLASVIRNEPGKEGELAHLQWWLCLGVLPWVAHGVSLVAAERSTAYRTLYALSGLALVVVFAALHQLPIDEKKQLWVRYSVLAALLLTAAGLAAYQSYTLIAQPQAREWSLVRSAVMQARLQDTTRIYVIEPTLADRSTARVHYDEFGSLSSDSDWVPKEMVKAALRERFPAGLPKGRSIDYAQSKEPPADGAADVVIDMRQMKQWRH
jgi:hypothetical protein